MKNLTLLLAMFLIHFTATAQVRIETPGSPDFLLHNTNALNNGVYSKLLFKCGGYYSGGIASMGTSANAARLSFYTNTSADQNNILERMSIANNGYVGIANNNPQYPFHLKSGGIVMTNGTYILADILPTKCIMGRL